jgi:predicted metal-dependent peptidase
MSIEQNLVKSRVKLLKESPFFGTLLLNTKYRVTEDISTAATDGDILMLNEKFMESQTPEHFRSILLHEVLHMALEHIERMKDVFNSDPLTANLAADIVVNGIIQDNRLQLPKEAITDDDLKHLSVREIYSILRQKQREDPDYLQKKYGDNGTDVNQCLQPGAGKQDGDKKSQQQQQGGEGQGKTNWKDVLNKAATIARSKNAGPIGSGMSRIFKEFLEPTINWKDLLYKYITSARTDFEGFDRRMIYQGMYLDDLGGGKIKVALFMDTSGSVDEELLSEFFAEVKFAINAFPNTEGEMWYFDTELYPEGDIRDIDRPQIKGGGGTSFSPVMKKLQQIHEEDASSRTVGIVFTDGYASMNILRPDCDVLWCISPGGVDDSYFNFGDVVRILK